MYALSPSLEMFGLLQRTLVSSAGSFPPIPCTAFASTSWRMPALLLSYLSRLTVIWGQQSSSQGLSGDQLGHHDGGSKQTVFSGARNFWAQALGLVALAGSKGTQTSWSLRLMAVLMAQLSTVPCVGWTGSSPTAAHWHCPLATATLPCATTMSSMG